MEPQKSTFHTQELEVSLIFTYYADKKVLCQFVISFALFLGVETKEGVYRERMYHTYYMWIPYLLLENAFSFYIPYLVWKLYDQGKFEVKLFH